MSKRTWTGWVQGGVLALAALLAGCGGGGGGAEEETLTPAQAQEEVPEAQPSTEASQDDVDDAVHADLLRSAPEAGAAHFARLTEVRRAMGLAPLRWNGALAAAAQSHADYLARHRMSGHEQVPGTEGFTGESIADRARLHGYRGKLVQETKIGGQSLTAGQGRSRMDDLLQAPLHRLQLLAPEFDDAGVGAAADGSPLVTNLGASGRRLRVFQRRWMYPYQGQQDVPVAFRPGSEVGLPEDMPAVTGTPLTLSGFLFSMISYSSVSLVEEASGAEVPLIAQAPPGQVRAALIFFPAAPLQPATHYVWRITAKVDRVTSTTVAKFVTSARKE